MNKNMRVEIEVILSQEDLEVATKQNNKEDLAQLIFDLGSTVLECALHQSREEAETRRNKVSSKFVSPK